MQRQTFVRVRGRQFYVRVRMHLGDRVRIGNAVVSVRLRAPASLREIGSTNPFSSAARSFRMRGRSKFGPSHEIAADSVR
jgi:hypothetical protein